MIKIGVVGYGYWGPNLVRNFAETPGAAVAAVVDRDTAKLDLVRRRYPGVKTTTNFQDLLTDSSIDVVALATPVNTHFEFGMAALKAGKHLWVEKPMTETVFQARKLADEAERRSLVLFVDHTFIYTGAVRKIAEIVRSGELGDIFYFDSTRVNLGLFQRDVSVIADLAVHDFSILDCVCSSPLETEPLVTIIRPPSSTASMDGRTIAGAIRSTHARLPKGHSRGIYAERCLDLFVDGHRALSDFTCATPASRSWGYNRAGAKVTRNKGKETGKRQHEGSDHYLLEFLGLRVSPAGQPGCGF
jgi:predicted dehydrogenase